MPTPRVAMRKIKECLRLKLECGLSLERVAKALGLSKGVVAKYVTRAGALGLDWPTLAVLDESAIASRLCSPVVRTRGQRAPLDLPAMHRELHRKGMTLLLLWQEYQQTHVGLPTYQYTQFCQYYHEYAATLRRSMRQVHRAGEKLYIDYAGQTVPLVNPETGEMRRAHIFVAVLGASNYTYACATDRETQVDWLRGLSQAFAYFGGVTQLVVPDNPKALITVADRYEPEVTLAAHRCAEHFGTAILPARPRHPQDKAKVEVGVQIVERWILARLRHQTFFSLAALNHAIADLLVDLNQRPFKKLIGTRRSWFESIDQPALMPLPAGAFEPASFKRAKVHIDYHIDIDGHYYSVPHSLVGKTVEARITDTVVEILHAGQRVASHLRSTSQGRHTTANAHMPASHRAHRNGRPSASAVGLATSDQPRWNWSITC